MVSVTARRVRGAPPVRHPLSIALPQRKLSVVPDRGLLFALVAFVLCSLLLSGNLFAQSKLSFEALPVRFDKPLGLVHDNSRDDRVYVFGKDGPIHRYNLVTGDTVRFLDMTDVIEKSGETGLFGAAFHPNPDSNYFYLSYAMAGARPELPVVLCISRFEVGEDGLADRDSKRVILTVEKPQYNQNGGGLNFGPDGYLYFGTGDGGGRDDQFDNGQNPQSMLGKLLRIDVDRQENGKNYAIPPNNPFVASEDTLSEIWSLGLRNPFRFNFDREKGDLWISDKANSFYQEVNFQPAGNPGGQNYGWNCREGFDDFPAASQRHCTNPEQEYDNPHLVYGKSGDNDFVGGSITGGYVYRGPDENLQGLYIFGDFFTHRIFLYDPETQDGDTLRVEVNAPVQNLTSFGTDKAGEIYAVDYNGTVYRIESSEPTTAVTARAAVTSLAAYPNPTGDGQVSISMPGDFANEGRLSVYTADGRRLSDAPYRITDHDRTIRVPLDTEFTGLFTLKITDGAHMGVARVVAL